MYNEKYIIHEVPHSASGDSYDESSPLHLGEESCETELHILQFPGGPSNVLGRFFVEVSL